MAYTEITWEFESDIKDDNKITEYKNRQKVPSPKSWKIKARPPPGDWKEYKESPTYKGENQLRTYQLEGLNWLTFCWYNNRNSILADEMGLGKTVQTVAVINHLYENLNIHGPFLIVAPLITVPHWQREFEGWTNMNAIVYHGTAQARDLIRKYEWSYESLKGSPPPYKFNVLITTYEMILTDSNILSKINWKYLAVDEAHRLKNTKCKLINALRLFQFDHLLLLTGTPLQNNTEELWTLLNFMDPDKFASADEFSESFGDLKKTKQVEQLHEVLRPYLLRRMKEDVEKSIAPKEETIVEVELTTIQKSYYRAIFERNFTSLNMGAKASNVPSLLNIMMQLRKCCNHPYLLRGVEDNIVKTHNVKDENELMISSCGKLVLVDKLLAKLKESGHKVLIFSQMIRMLDILEDYLIHKNYLYERIDGNKRGNERQEAIDRFSAPDSDRFVFLLCTRAGGLGINLTAADTCIIYDSDWNPQNDIQAQARCHRIGQTQKVKIYRLITRNTYEKAMFQKASLKLGLDQVVLTKMKSSKNPSAAATTDDTNMTTNAALRAMDKKEIEELLRYGAYKTFTEEGNNEDDKFDEQDIDQILERNSTTIVHDSSNGGTGGGNGENNLSSFSKASFISASAESNADLDVSDPDFWKKLLPGNETSSNNNNNSSSSHSSNEKSTRARYSLRETADRFPLYDAYLSSDDEGAPDVDDDHDDAFDYGNGNSWTSRERAKVKSSLSYYGYGQWPTIRSVGNLHRWSIRQIQAYSDALILNCVTQIDSEDPHTVLKFLRKWSIYEPLPPNEPVDNDQYVDFSLDPSLTDPNFSLYKQSNAKPFVRKLENIAKISKAVQEACRDRTMENFNVPSTSGEPPCSTWTCEDDKSLIFGTFYHGYGRYEKMRTDTRLSFSRFTSPNSNHQDPTNKSIPNHEDGDDHAMDDDDDDDDDDLHDNGPPLPNPHQDKDGDVSMATPHDENSKEEWPSEKLLHRQLRKALRALSVPDEDTYVPDPKVDDAEENIDMDDDLLEPERKQRKRYFSANEWSKREKQAIYRYCVAFGIPDESNEKDWNDFKASASLTRKSLEQIQLYCSALVDTAEAIADKDKKKSTDWSVQVEGDLTLTKAQSKRLVQRVRIFKDLRNYLTPRLEELPSLLQNAGTSAMPSWWIPSIHDYALIHGILKHGFGQWEKLCADKSLPFYSIAEQKLSPHKSKQQQQQQQQQQQNSSDETSTTTTTSTPGADTSDVKMADDNDDSVQQQAAAAAATEVANGSGTTESGGAAVNALTASTSGAGSDSESEDDGDDEETTIVSSGTASASRRKRKRGRRADVFTTAVNFPKEKGILKRLRYLIKYINDSSHSPSSMMENDSMVDQDHHSSSSLSNSQSDIPNNNNAIKSSTANPPNTKIDADNNTNGDSSTSQNNNSSHASQQLSPNHPLSPKQQQITKRAPLKLSTDSLSILSSPSSPSADSPRSNRKHKICAGRKPATKKYHEIPSNADGTPIFPIVFGKMRIESLGEVVFDKPNYHNDRYIWPVGYKSVRPYQSFVDTNSRTEYTSEIVDGGDRPLFQVTAADAPNQPGTGNSPTAAWTGILRKLNEKSNKPFNAVSGPEYFGLAKGIISKVS